MRHFLSAVFSSTLLSITLFAATASAGDCNKTVMGGGCSAGDAGVSPHMVSQAPLNADTKNKAKAIAAAAAKPAAPAKNMNVSNAPGQKPQI